MFLTKKRGKPLPQTGGCSRLPFILMLLLIVCSDFAARAANLYWIGGSGNWSDIRHWAKSSGNRNGLLASGIPMPTDNVIFDQHSGFNAHNGFVNINQESNCNDLVTTQLPFPITMSGSVINVYGSAYFGSGTILNNSLYLRGSASHELDFFNGATGQGAFYFLGTGKYILKGELRSSAKICFLNGKLDFGSSRITTGYFTDERCCDFPAIGGTDQRKLDLGSATITLTDRNGHPRQQSSSWKYTGRQLNCGTSNIVITKGTADGYGVNFTGNKGHTYHRVSFTNTEKPSNPSPYAGYQVNSGGCHFASLSFASDGYIASDATIDTLLTARSATYYFTGSQFLNVVRNMTGICDPFWTFQGYGDAAVSIRLSQPLEFQNAKVGNLNIRVHTITVNRGRDGGNNQGIIFNDESRSLYWIGGGGKWNDPVHWTTNANGMPSGGCLPTRHDHVFFGDYSGAISINNPVIINTADAECLSVTWKDVQGTPAFVSEKREYGLSVYGSCTWQQGMVYRIATTTYTGTRDDNVITSNGVFIHGETRFVSSGKWILADDFASDNDLTFLSGTIDAQGKNISVRNLGATGAATGIRLLNIRNSRINILENWSYANFGGPALYLEAAGSTIRMLGKNALFRYLSKLHYHNIDFENEEGTAVLRAELFSTRDTCIFNTINCKGSAQINYYGAPTPLSIAHLLLAPGKAYLLGINMPVLLQAISLNSSACKGMGSIRSAIPGTQARINFTKPQSLSRFLVSDLNCSGNELIITEGMDGGNISGIKIMPTKPRDLYWIGGSGKWSNPSHWSYRPDGSVTETVCLPNAQDHVHFTVHSGNNYTVELDVPAACGDMSWDQVESSKPTLLGLKSSPLTINGSLVLQRRMNFNVERLEFTGKGEKSVTTNGVALRYAQSNRSDKGVFFKDNDGIWKLTDAMDVKNIALISGTLKTLGHAITAENWVSERADGSKKARLLLDSSIVTIGGYWDASEIDSIDAGKSVIILTGSLSATNESGNGLYTNQFRSAPGHIYHKVRFDNPLMGAKLISYDDQRGYIFDYLSFATEASINSSNIFHSLTTSGSLHFSEGSVQQIGRWVNTSSCRQWDLDNNCTAPSGGCDHTKRAKIISSSPISLNKVRMSGIEISGSSDHTAFGTDMGNNSGWTFLPAKGRTLYWIGGSGYYSDPRHWTVNADGTPSADSCPPTQSDHVVFNRFSGESPNISSQYPAKCRDMNWTDVPGKPVFDGLIHCYGSLILQSSLIHYGGVTFLSTGSEIIETRGAVVARNFDVNFSGGGTYLLADDFTTASHINLTKGALHTNGKTVRALSLNGIEPASPDSGTISLALGSSRIYLSYYHSGWQYTASKLDAGTSHIFLTGDANVFKSRDGLTYHNVSFDNSPNTKNYIYGSFKLDTLTFARRNSNYFLESSKTVTVAQQLYMSGNPCATLSVAATSSGQQVNLNILGGDTTFNFISVKDINAAGKKLKMLDESADLGNNAQITFNAKKEHGIGLLGPDQTVCVRDFPIVLSSRSFLPDRNTVIKWTDRKTGKIAGSSADLQINHPGTYAIDVIYGKDCGISDTIRIYADAVDSILKFVRIQQPGCSRTVGSVHLAAATGITYRVDGKRFSDALFYELPAGRHYILAKSKAGCISDTAFVTIHPAPVKPEASISYPLKETRAEGMMKVIFSGTFGGSYSVSPAGLALDSVSGTIDLSKSEPGRAYTVSYQIGSGDCAVKVNTVLSILPTPTSISYPLPDYCAVGLAEVTTEGVKGGFYASTPGLKIDAQSGTIDLGKSLAGQYTVIYTYFDGSLRKTAEIPIKINPLPSVRIYSDKTTIMAGETLRLTATGGLSYSWIGNNIVSASDISSILIQPSKSSTYRVLVANENGCIQSADYAIEVRKPASIIPNNIVTPNGDGKNDYWVIANIEDYPNNSVKIFDRAGRLIYMKKGYHNEWDGRLNGHVLSEDAYLYVIDPGNGKALIRGTVSVVIDPQIKQ